MNSRQNRVDEHGFPIPPTFDNPSRQDDSFGAGPGWLGSKAVRVVLGIFIAVVAIGVVFGPQIVGAAREALALKAMRSAEQKFNQGDAAGAAEEAERAMAWQPDEKEYLYWRAYFRLHAGKLDDSLSDINAFIEEFPDNHRGYTLRSIIYQRQGRHEDAVADTTTVLKLRNEEDHVALNQRAYTRAIGKIELEEGLEDVERALRLSGEDNAAYLDTRAYLLHLLGKNDQALADMEKAIELTEDDRMTFRARVNSSNVDPALVKQAERQLDEHLAVMYHHRGLIHQALGNEAKAKADLALAEKLGYNPEAGVY